MFLYWCIDVCIGYNVNIILTDVVQVATDLTDVGVGAISMTRER